MILGVSQGTLDGLADLCDDIRFSFLHSPRHRSYEDVIAVYVRDPKYLNTFWHRRMRILEESKVNEGRLVVPSHEIRVIESTGRPTYRMFVENELGSQVYRKHVSNERRETHCIADFDGSYDIPLNFLLPIVGHKYSVLKKNMTRSDTTSQSF